MQTNLLYNYIVIYNKNKYRFNAIFIAHEHEIKINHFSSGFC